MRDVLTRIRPDVAAPALLALTIVCFACGSSGVPAVRDVGSPLRWVALLAFAAAAVALAWTTGGARLGPRATTVSAGAFLGIAFLSAAWSVRPALTLARTGSVALLFVAAFGIAAAAAADRRVACRALLAVAGAGVAVALAGIAVLALSRGYAMQSAETTSAARHRGLGENPNTMPMLFALALPATLGIAFAVSGKRRVLAVAGMLLLAGSIFAAGSRGAALAALVGVLVVVGARTRTNRMALVAVVLAVFAAGIGLGELPSPKQAATVVVPSGSAPDFPTVDSLATLDGGPNLIGQPRPGETSAPAGRSLLGSSGRVQAWRGALDQALERPSLGYGFGTEERVFFDRYYVFFGMRPENSLLGLLLQVGVIGLLAFLALVASAAATLVRAWRAGASAIVGPFAGIIAAGAVLALVQSYVYSVGNIATVTLWMALVVGPAVAAAETRRG